MRKFKALFILLSVLFTFVFFGCNEGKKDSASESIIEPSFTVIEDDTTKVLEMYTPKIDVQPANLKITITVLAPNGENVTVDENNSFIPTQIGTYKIKVKCENILEEKTITLNVVDGNAPVISAVPEDIESVELGEYDFKEDLDKVKAKDDVDGEIVKKGIVSVKLGDETIQKVGGNKFQFTKTGTYTILGNVSDSSGNSAEFSYKIKFVDTIKPIVSGENTKYVFSKNGYVTIPLDLDIQDASKDITLNYIVEGLDVVEGKIKAETGTFKVTYTAFDGFNKSEPFIITLIVKSPGEIFNFETVDGKTNGLTFGTVGEDKYGTSDWGQVEINKDKNYVKSGDQSLKITLDKDKGKGQTFYDDERIYGGEKDANTFSFYAYVEENTLIQIYLMTGSGNTLKYNYSAPIELLKGGHNYKYYYTFDFDPSFYTKHVINIQDGLSGFIIKNIGDKATTVYLDDICFMYSELDNTIEFKEDKELKTETGMQFNIPIPKFLYPQNYFNLTIEVLNDLDEVVDNIDLENGNYIFTTPGNFKLNYKSIDKLTGKETILLRKVQVLKGKPFAFFEEKLPNTILVNEEIELPKIQIACFEEGLNLNVYYVDANKIEQEIISNNGKYIFKPLNSGTYKIILRISKDEYVSNKSYDVEVKLKGEIFNFETDNGITNGLTHGSINDPQYGTCDWGKVEVNKDKKYVGNGNQSIKITIPTGKEKGQTFYDNDRIFGGEKGADTFTFYAYVEEDVEVQVYLMTGSGNTLKYNYSKPILLKKGGHTYTYNFTKDFDQEYWSKHIINIEDGLSGFTFKNNNGKEIVIYVDDFCFIKSESTTKAS